MREEAGDSEEVVTPLMLDGTYLSRNFATLGPVLRDSRREKKDKKIVDTAVIMLSLDFFSNTEITLQTIRNRIPSVACLISLRICV